MTKEQDSNTDIVGKNTSYDTSGTISIHWHIILAGLSALLMGMVFPQIGWSWLVYICLAPLGILSARSLKRIRLAWTVWIIFFIWWLVMIRWMVPVTIGGYIALSAFMALYTTVFALTINIIKQNLKTVPMVIVLPAVWVSLEFIKAVFPFGGFNWFTLGSATLPYLPAQGAGHVAQTADLFGQYTVSFIVAISSGFIVDFFTLPLLRRVPTDTSLGYKTRIRKTISICFLFWLIIFLASYFYGSFRIAQFNSTTTSAINVAVVQTNIAQSNKMSPSKKQQDKNWNHLLNLAKQAAQTNPKPDLIVWPETMVPAPLNDSALKVFTQVGSDISKYRQQIESLTRKYKVNLLAGAPTMTDWQLVSTPNGNERYKARRRYNSAYLFSYKGNIKGRYDKIHLVPFGEYIPIVETYPAIKHWFIHTLSPYGFDYTTNAGTKLKIFHLSNSNLSTTNFSTPICFEDTIASLCRRMVYSANGKKQSNLLVNITNDGWFKGTSEPEQHAQIAALRCIENRVPMARSVNTAMSGFIDSTGKAHSLVTVDGKHENVSGVSSYTIKNDNRITLYGKVGKIPVTVLTILTFTYVILNILFLISVSKNKK